MRSGPRSSTGQSSGLLIRRLQVRVLPGVPLKSPVEALTTNLQGEQVIPVTAEAWDDWVSASATRNHVLENPLLDWLNRWGERKGLLRDGPEMIDERTDFRTFIFRKGNEFEQAVVRHLTTVAAVHTIYEGDHQGRRDLAVATATFEAMARGEEVIYQGVVRDAESRTWGSPDFLVRSDVLARLFPASFSAVEAAVAAPDLPGDWHYRVVDSKFATLGLAAGGELTNGGSAPAYKAQVFIYNRALGRLQGYEPPSSFLLGRGWEQERGGQTRRGSNCMDRLAPVAQDYSSIARGPLASQADAAVAWLRRMRREGGDWTPAPAPSVDELRAVAGGDNAPWTKAVGNILTATEDLTVLYGIGGAKRTAANQAGILRWSDPALTPQAIGIEGETAAPRFQALLDVNRDGDGAVVRPAHIETRRNEWHPVPRLEFYVDFETVSNLDDDFSQIPNRGGLDLIFMVGCGHFEGGQWIYRCFPVRRLTEPHEAQILDAWFAHMHAIFQRLAPKADPKVIHWSFAEQTWLETADHAAVKRHPEKDWPRPNWFDFLTQVMRAEPVVVRGRTGSISKGSPKRCTSTRLWSRSAAPVWQRYRAGSGSWKRRLGKRTSRR